jgi:muramoyltetrapeptide carboxypeptidase
VVRPVRPNALHSGAMLGIVSPAGFANPEKVAAGVAHLHSLGYRTKLFPHALDRGPLNYAGPLESRLADLHAAFADDSVDGIVCTRGGWGSAELLPYLNAALIAEHAKVFCGYSDITSLHIWLRNEVGLVTFYAPMVAADFSKPDGVNLPSWSAALQGEQALGFDSLNGLRVLRPGMAEGEVSGGCLAILAESAGTPYAPKQRCGILFLEDIATRAYQWDRMLLHLRYAGWLEGVEGIVFGDMTQCGESAGIEAAILHGLRDFKGPIAIGLRSGHVDAGNVTIPFGVRAQLDLSEVGNPRMHFLEAAVEV